MGSFESAGVHMGGYGPMPCECARVLSRCCEAGCSGAGAGVKLQACG